MSQQTAQTAYPPDRTPEEAVTLFKAIEDKFPSANLGDDRWYLIPVRPSPKRKISVLAPAPHVACSLGVD